MKIGPASIELRPLRDDELKLCLTLLRAALNKKKEMSALIRDFEEFVLRTMLRGRADGGDEFLSNELFQAFTEKAARKKWRTSVRKELWDIQSLWRGRANGPMFAFTNSHPRNTNNKVFEKHFDSWCLEKIDIQLPPLKFRERSVSGRKIQKPYLAISVSSTTELFQVLLIRAVSNGQLSRLARCVVCGNWELKARSGRRSQAKIEYMECHSDIRKWSKFWVRVPQWPGLCVQSVCRDRFTNVARERSSFQEKDFPGLQGRGLTQYLPRGFRPGSTPDL